MNILTTGFETTPIAMEPMWQIAFQAPSDDVDRIFHEHILGGRVVEEKRMREQGADES